MSTTDGSSPIVDRLARPLRDLRISVTDRCNLRCPYCMPADRFPEQHPFLPREDLLSFEEIAVVAEELAQLGVRKLRITGGEPLMRRDLPTLIRLLAAIPGIEDIALTTNGILLPRYAEALKEAGLDRITLSLDALDPDIYHKMAGGKGSVEEALVGLAAAQAAGFCEIKVNTVVIRGMNDHCIPDLAEYFRHSGVILRFIEYMDVGTLNQWQREEVVSAREILKRIEARFPLQSLEPNYTGEVARRYAYADGAGEIGIIASITQPFCGDCGRLRMSADGTLYTCLFAQSGTSVRDLLRQRGDRESLQTFLTNLWQQREDRYSEERRENDARPRAEMYHLGG